MPKPEEQQGEELAAEYKPGQMAEHKQAPEHKPVEAYKPEGHKPEAWLSEE